MATYTQNALATVSNLASGSLKCYVYIDDTISPALTVPTSVNIVDLAPIREAVDLRAGEVDLDTLTVTIADDYTTYTDGFWWELIENNSTKDVQMMFILTESGTDTYLFRGSISRENTNWTEHYISGSTYVRTVAIQLVSPMLMLKTISVTSMVAYLVNAVTGNGAYLVEGTNDALSDNCKMCTLANIINNMVEMAFGATDEGYQVVERGCDIKFWNTYTSAYGNPTSFYLAVQRYDTDYYNADLFDDDTEPLSWTSRYDNCWELLTAICLSLGMVPRYYFGDTNGVYTGTASDKHTIEILCRGDKTTTVITNTSIISSNVVSDSTQKYLNIITHQLAGEDSQLYAVINGSYYTSSPENITYDLEVTQEFTSDTTETVQRYFHYIDAALGTNVFKVCTKCEYYDHTNDGMTVVTFINGTNALLEVLTKYMYLRFSTGRKEYNRSYGTIVWGKSGLTSSHQHLRILARYEIDSVAYYATDIKKDIVNNRCEVKWLQE